MSNILFLDMDGVVNSTQLKVQWCRNKEEELGKSGKFPDFLSLRAAVQTSFSEFIKHGEEYIFPELASMISEEVRKWNLKLIWSSTWRNLKTYSSMKAAKKMFSRRGLPGEALMGYTPDFRMEMPFGSSSNRRVQEIVSFVRSNSLGISFEDRIGAIDDWNLKGLEEFGIHFFQTDDFFGITPQIQKEMDDFYGTEVS